MKYQPLEKFYYKHGQSEALLEEEYQKRLHTQGVKYYPLLLKQYGRKEAYPAFLVYTEEIILLQQQIFQQQVALVKLNYQVPALLRYQFILQCITDEIKSTNDIEGVRSTKKEIRAVIDKPRTSKEYLRLSGIVDKYMKILEGSEVSFTSCEDIRSFYDEFALQEVLEENPDHALDGRLFRQGQVEITKGTTKVVHQGVYPEEKIIEYLTAALQLLHDKREPVLIRIAVFHYLFGYIHPFYDGNGRMGRFIASYYLAQEFDATVALRLSVVIKKQKEKYYNSFSATEKALNRGDLTMFVTGFLQYVAAAFTETIAILTRKQAQYAKYLAKLEAMELGDEVCLRICKLLFEAAFFFGQGVTIKQLMDLSGYSRVTVQKRLDGLAQEYLLVDKGSKPYKYRLNMLVFKE